MNGFGDMCGRLFLPVRRKLMCLTVCWICGILLASAYTFPFSFSGLLCALSLLTAALRLSRRKSALFCAMLCLFLTANTAAGYLLSVKDIPTEPGVFIEGIVSEVKKPLRIYVSDVTADGVSLKRDALVTLMLEEGETPHEVRVGQFVSGIGRLFEPETPRNPGGVNRRFAALADGYELSGYILPGWRTEGDGEFSIRECLRRLREMLGAKIEHLFGEQAPLFQAMLLGDRSGLDEELVASMRLSGTVHILTVSGLHLSLIAGAVKALLQLLPLGRMVRFCLMSGILSLYAGITGFAAGTVRALIMALLRELAVIRGKRYEPLTALSFAALTMTIFCPLWALDGSFQFSFFIVLGIQLLASGFSAVWNKSNALPGGVRRLLSAISVSAGAQIAAVPMQLLFYGYLPVLSLIMNLLCGMLVPFLMLGGCASLAVSMVFFPFGRNMASALGLAAYAFEQVNLLAAAVKGSVLRLPSPYGITILLFAAWMMLLSGRIRFGKARKRAAAGTVLLMLALYLPRFDLSAQYVQLDVGQGDGALFRRGRSAVLVDVGPQDSYDMLRYLRHEGLFVEAVILSHLDEDHAGALDVLRRSEIAIPALVLTEGAIGEETTEIVLGAIGALALEGTKICEVKRGDRIEVLGMNMDVISPDASFMGSNERSLLLSAEMEGVPFLLTGDLPSECEPEYVPDCTVLKVAHHGSRNATSDAFLSMAKPEIAMISVGAGNGYGHPTQRVLDSLDKAGSTVLRTDENGCITLYLRGGKVRAKTYIRPNI